MLQYRLANIGFIDINRREWNLFNKYVGDSSIRAEIKTLDGRALIRRCISGDFIFEYLLALDANKYSMSLVSSKLDNIPNLNGELDISREGIITIKYPISRSRFEEGLIIAMAEISILKVIFESSKNNTVIDLSWLESQLNSSSN